MSDSSIIPSMLDRDEIRRRREQAGLSLRDAARLAGWGDGDGGRSRWHRVETGDIIDPQLSSVEAMARALGCKVDNLLTTKE